ncbi:MAG: hypothetical protein IIB45_07795 [Candidatus Marinimicrobia bacterium]|nr:hypothetical protein [Candidatus Neomarinimicrobiota bacterium]
MSTDLTFFTNKTVQIIQTFPERLNFPISQPLADQLTGEIPQAMPEESKKQILKPLAEELNIGKQQTLSVELVTSLESLLTHFTFTHFTELSKIDDPLKRAFYE